MTPLIRPTFQTPHQRFFRAVLLVATILALAGMTSAAAQGVHQYGFPGSSSSSGYGASTGGKVYNGTAVPTGRSPLDQPIPPAASSLYSRQTGRAATPTNPSPYPFGTQ
jgi:hypothetical protein